jgi:chromosome segregation ATPase
VVLMTICKDCGNEHPKDYEANPHYCIARMDEKIEELTDLLKKSEEEMLFWRREFRLLNAAETKAEEEIERLQAERDGYRNGQQQMQDMNAKLIDANNALKAEIDRLKARPVLDDGVTGRQWMIEQEASHE